MTFCSQFYELRLNSIVLQEDAVAVRSAPRPSALRQNDYLEKFDDRTMFYDCFVGEDGSAILNGPPLLNLRESLAKGDWRVDGELCLPELSDLDRTQRSSLPGRFVAGARLEVDSSLGRFETTLGGELNGVFEGRKVLMTKSKNNRLEWIRDWIEFHVQVHGYDAILFYDNDSSDYSSRKLLNVISAVPGVCAGVVVSWPFKFGPQAGDYGGVKDAPWDSDFTEYSILEHARFRFLADAAYISNHDIDELVICSDGRTVFDHVEEHSTRAIRYKGRWIERLGQRFGEVPRFSDFIYFDIDRRLGTTKWTASGEAMKASKQWSTHNIRGIPMTNVDKVLHRHFKGISNSWKYDRNTFGSVDVARLAVDRELEGYLISAFGRSDHRLDRQASAADLGAYYVDSLRGVIDSANFWDATPRCTEVRWHKDHIAVVECDVGDIGFGFDIVASVDGVRAEVVGRGQHRDSLPGILGDRFRELSDSKLLVANLSWTMGVPVIGACLVRSLLEVVERMEKKRIGGVR